MKYRFAAIATIVVITVITVITATVVITATAALKIRKAVNLGNPARKTAVIVARNSSRMSSRVNLARR